MTIEGPAKLRPGYEQNRLLGAEAGAKKGWRNEDEAPLDAYARRGLLAGGALDGPTKGITLDMRLRAGHDYRRLCELARRAGRDSTEMVIVGSGGGGSITETQSDAIKSLISVDSHLSQNDRRLVRMVCDEGYRPSEAVRTIDPGYKDGTVPRFREAMDALVLAFEAARRSGWVFKL